jgi:hypothetical protein
MGESTHLHRVKTWLYVWFGTYILATEEEIMEVTPTLTLNASMGFKARKLRVTKLLTQRELAENAGVSLEEVDLFEHDLPVPLDARRRILKELWSRKV